MPDVWKMHQKEITLKCENRFDVLIRMHLHAFWRPFSVYIMRAHRLIRWICLSNKNRNHWKCTVKICFVDVYLSLFNACTRSSQQSAESKRHCFDFSISSSRSQKQDHTQHQAAISKTCMKSIGRHVSRKNNVTGNSKQVYFWATI